MRLLLAMACVLLVGCQSSPENVFFEAREAAENEDFSAYRTLFTQRSATLLDELRRVREQSKGDYEYLSDKEVFALLPPGEIARERTEIEGRRAVLQVGKSDKHTEEVILLREPAGWRLDLYHSKRFWAPLVVKED